MVINEITIIQLSKKHDFDGVFMINNITFSGFINSCEYELNEGGTYKVEITFDTFQGEFEFNLLDAPIYSFYKINEYDYSYYVYGEYFDGVVYAGFKVEVDSESLKLATDKPIFLKLLVDRISLDFV